MPTIERNIRYKRTSKGLLTQIINNQKQRSKKRGFAPPEYSLKEFHDKFIADKKFIRLFKEWVKADYNKNKTPSFDRISFKKPYTFSNISLKTWSENRLKQKIESKMFYCKTVLMKRDGVLVRKFKSVGEAARVTKLHQSNISRAIANQNRTCGGYNWQYE